MELQLFSNCIVLTIFFQCVSTINIPHLNKFHELFDEGTYLLCVFFGCPSIGFVILQCCSPMNCIVPLAELSQIPYIQVFPEAIHSVPHNYMVVDSSHRFYNSCHITSACTYTVINMSVIPFKRFLDNCKISFYCIDFDFWYSGTSSLLG